MLGMQLKKLDFANKADDNSRTVKQSEERFFMNHVPTLKSTPPERKKP